METQKILSLILFGILSVFLISAFASATYTSTATTALSTSANGVITLTNTNASGTIALNAVASGDFSVLLSTTNPISVTVGTPVNITVTPATSTTLSSLPFGINTATITFSDNASPAVESSQTVSFDVEKHFCSSGVQGNDLVLRNADVTNDGEGNEDEWQPLDTIKVEVEAKNDGNVSIDDIKIALALFDSSGNDVTGDLNFINSDDEEITIGKLKDGKSATETFEFEIPADLALGDYKLALKTFSDDLGEASACDDTTSDLTENDLYNDISLDFDEDNPIIVDESSIKFSSASVQPGDKVTLTFDVYNVGDNDEDQVRVNLFSTDLGIDQSLDIKSGLDSTDGEKMEYTFTVPSSTKAGTYSVKFTVDYDYDSRNDEYDESSTNTWTASLSVIGTPVEAPLKVGVSASLVSAAKAGGQIVVKATITNNENTAMSFVVDAKNFESWAELVSISDRLLSLDAGESQEVTFTLKANKDVSGEETFLIETTAGSKVSQKEVAVNVENSSFLSRFGGNSLLWVIGAVNVLLIALIIFAVIKLSR